MLMMCCFVVVGILMVMVLVGPVGVLGGRPFFICW